MSELKINIKAIIEGQEEYTRITEAIDDLENMREDLVDMWLEYEIQNPTMPSHDVKHNMFVILDKEIERLYATSKDLGTTIYAS